MAVGGGGGGGWGGGGPGFADSLASFRRSHERDPGSNTNHLHQKT